MRSRARSRWRLLTSEAVEAAEGLAVDEALLLHYGPGRHQLHDATLRLYTYRSHCALVGRYQNLEDELDLDACTRLGVSYNRRPTGGGAIIMGAGQLGVAVCTRAPTGLGPRALLRQYAEGVTAGLAKLGIQAHFRAKNDLEVGGRKIAGLGLYVDDRGALLFHASVLADLDVSLMLQVLRIPGAKLSDKAVARVGERVTTVSWELGRRVRAVDLREPVREGFAAALGLCLQPGDLDLEEKARVDQLLKEKYGNAAWVHQRSPLPDSRGNALLKTPEGLLRFHVGVHGDTLKSLLITGDFNTMPASVARLEASLRWSPADPVRIRAACAQALADGELGVPADEVARAVWKAACRALDRNRHPHPLRVAGSCYFPDP